MTTAPVLMSARDYYLSHGEPPLPLNGAIALSAVLYYESKLNPGSQGYQSTEHGGVLNPHGAFGIASWNGPADKSKVGDPAHDRQSALAAFATKRGLQVGLLDTQLAFVLTEMANGYPASWAAVRSSASIAAIIESIVDDYENPKDKAREIAGALIFAEALAELPAPVPSTAPVPQAPWPIPSVPDSTVPVPQPPMPVPPAGLPPVSATSAARTAAAINQLNEMREMRIVELVAEDQEIRAIDVSLAAFEAFQGSSAPALPSTKAKSAATTQGSIMLPILKSVLTNWVTSLGGAAIGSPALLDIINSIGTATGPNWKADIGPLAMMLIGLASKDGWITGGVVPATPEAKTRVGK